MSPFDIVKHLNEKTDDVIDMKDYPPWIVNKSLSHNQQTIHFANAMNRCFSLDKDIQYAFYLHGIPKGKRFGKWVKKIEVTDLIKLVSSIYSISEKTAMQYVELMTEEQKEKLCGKFDKGGKYGVRSK